MFNADDSKEIAPMILELPLIRQLFIRSACLSGVVPHVYNRLVITWTPGYVQ